MFVGMRMNGQSVLFGAHVAGKEPDQVGRRRQTRPGTVGTAATNTTT